MARSLVLLYSASVLHRLQGTQATTKEGLARRRASSSTNDNELRTSAGRLVKVNQKYFTTSREDQPSGPSTICLRAAAPAESKLTSAR